jgi:hypothetical protein
LSYWLPYSADPVRARDKRDAARRRGTWSPSGGSVREAQTRFPRYVREDR